MNDDIFILIFETLIYGFCFTVFTLYFIHLFKTRVRITLTRLFFKHSIHLVRFIAILYALYLILHYISHYDYSLVENRATGTYAWAYWYMFLRPFIVILLIHLLWLKKFYNKGFYNFTLILLILIVHFFNGANLERYIIIISSIHRDYGTSDFLKIDAIWYAIWYKTSLLLLLMFIERTLIFSFLVFLKIQIKNLFTKSKN